jgi:c-di-GMP-binding flagellar brake protein YcgR
MLPQALLQANVARYIEDVNSSTSYIVMIVVIVLLGVFIFVGSRAKIGQGGGSRTSGLSLRKLSRQHGLDPAHYQILKRAVKDQKIQSPSALFTNSRFLTGVLRSLIVQVEATDYSVGQKEALKSELYEIKQRITSHTPSLNQAVSTKSMAINQDAVIYSKTHPAQQTYLVGKTAEALIFELPRLDNGDWVPYKIDQSLKIRYIKDDDKVFVFVSTVKDIREIENEMRLLVEHTGVVKRVQLRKSPRKEFFRPAYFYRVEVLTEGKGRKAVRKAAVDKNRRFAASLQDLSAGGCAMYARIPLPKGSLIMVSFDINKGNSINVFGKVRHLRKERATTLMHVMFTKVSTKHLNDIRAFVFGFVEDEERPRNNLIL